MPLELFKIKAAEIMKRHNYPHGGERALDMVIAALDDFFAVSKQSASIRLIETGMLDGMPVKKAWLANSDTTTTISIHDAFKIYCENEAFRDLIDTGAFIHVENKMVLNDEQYVIKRDGKFSLTPYARTHEDDCCITFTLKKVYPKSNTPGVAYHYDNRAAKKQPNFESGDNVFDAKELAEVKRHLEAFETEFGDFLSFKQSFCETVQTLMARRHWNGAIFRTKTHLDGMTYSRIMNNKLDAPDVRTVAAICVGLGVDAGVADKLYGAADLCFGSTKERQAYRYLYTALTGQPIEMCNAFLEDLGFAPLGCRSYTEKPLGKPAAATNG